MDSDEEDKSLESGRELLRASSKNLHGLWMFADPISQSDKLNKSIRLSRIEDRSSSKNNSEDEFEEEDSPEEEIKNIAASKKKSSTLKKTKVFQSAKKTEEENSNKNAIRVLITGGENTGKNMLFCRLVSEYCSIPFNTIWKDHHVTKDPNEAHPKWYFDILISVLKGVIEDTRGGVKDDFKTPLPFLTVNEGEVTFQIYSPSDIDYNSRIKYTNPMVDIVLHLVDMKGLKNLEEKDIDIVLEKQLKFIKYLRFKQLVIGVNKMECAKWSSASFEIISSRVKSAVRKLNIHQQEVINLWVI